APRSTPSRRRAEAGGSEHPHRAPRNTNVSPHRPAPSARLGLLPTRGRDIMILARVDPGEMRLELVPLSVRDVDASIAFYVGRVGFVLDHDVRPGNGMRIVQLTPPGSACSVAIGSGVALA